jgi:hypothetical protein
MTSQAAPSTSIARRLVRHKAPLLALWLTLLVAMSAWGAVRAIALVGQPFNGFLVQPLVYVSPFEASGWHLERTGLEVVDWITAVEGRPVAHPPELLAAARAVPVGTPLSYTVVRHGQTREVSVPTRMFTWADWLATEGMMLALGWEFSLIGLVVFAMRP